MKKFLRPLLVSCLVLTFAACCDTELNDRHYSGDHDDTVGLLNQPMYPPPSPVTETPTELAAAYDNAGPGGLTYETAASAPSDSTGGAGLWGYERAETPAPSAAAPTASGRPHGRGAGRRH